MNFAPICLAVSTSASIASEPRAASGNNKQQLGYATMMLRLRCLASTLRRQHRRHHIRAKDIIIHDAVVVAAAADAVPLAPPPLPTTTTYRKRDHYPP
jgi:hypothetical protein